MKRWICAAALAASAAFADQMGGPSAAAPAMPKPPAELSVEKWFVGTWTCKGQQHAGVMGPEMKTSLKLEMKMELAGFWLQYKGTMQVGPMKGKEIIDGFSTWDGSQHQRYDFQPGGLMHYTTKGWDGDKMIFEGDGMMGGQKTSMRHTITRKGDNEYASVLETDGKPLIEETCTRSGGPKA